MRELLAEGTLLRADASGDVVDAAQHGLFVADCRHLSHWELTVDGGRPRLLDAGADLVLVPAVGRGDDPPYTLFRHQAVAFGALRERVRVVNHGAEPLEVHLRWRFAADFADQFELRTDRVYAKPAAERGVVRDAGAVRLHYTRADFRRETVIHAPAGDGDTVHSVLTVPAHGDAAVTVVVSTGASSDGSGPADPGPRVGIEAPAARGTEAMDAAVRQGCADLTALLIPADPGEWVVAAGSPWFLTLFGRDSLFTAGFLLEVAPWVAANTLRALAATQGRVVDPARLEEPGKILHERRVGELSHFGDVPFGRYYGTVDATPLFLMLLAETGDDALAAELERPARAAVDWMFEHGGLNRVGWLVYRTDGVGLVHQCWKDSARGICFRSGEPALGELAVCEVQGYAYAALRGAAALARRVWHDPDYAARLDAYADALRTRFTEAFWLPEHDFPALALTGDGRRVDALASNAGHLLWAGLLDRERGVRVGRRLMAADFFSGWGIRTLAAGQPAYHPVSYHRGSVWPHDTALAAAGLARYGLLDEARLVTDGLLAAAAHHGHRLPEVLAGFGRDERPTPVPYPHACSPQAWAAAAPLLLDRIASGRPTLFRFDAPLGYGAAV